MKIGIVGAVTVTVAWLLSFTKVANAGIASQLPPTVVGRQQQQRHDEQQHSQSRKKLSIMVAAGSDASSAAANTHGHKMSMATLVINIGQ
jgi:hypothetical protein